MSVWSGVDVGGVLGDEHGRYGALSRLIQSLELLLGYEGQLVLFHCPIEGSLASSLTLVAALVVHCQYLVKLLGLAVHAGTEFRDAVLPEELRVQVRLNIQLVDVDLRRLLGSRRSSRGWLVSRVENCLRLRP